MGIALLCRMGPCQACDQTQVQLVISTYSQRTSCNFNNGLTPTLFFGLHAPRPLTTRSTELVDGIKVLINHGVVRARAQLMEQCSRVDVRDACTCHRNTNKQQQQPISAATHCGTNTTQQKLRQPQQFMYWESAGTLHAVMQTLPN